MEHVDIAICAMIKDEHKYLKEWIDYHLSIGVTSIYLYEDVESLSHKDICCQYENVYLFCITDLLFVYGEHTNKQLNLYNRCLEKYANQIDYVFFIDLDEFVTFKQGVTIKDWVNTCSEQGAILLRWKMYGANGLVNNPNNKVLDVFTKPVPNYTGRCLDYKTFTKVKGAKEPNIMRCHHRHISAEPTKIDSSRWRLNHYITKSWEEWCERILKRGQIVKDFRKLDDFFLYNPDMVSRKNELMSLITKENYGTNL